MSRRRFELNHSRQISGLERRHRADYLPSVRLEVPRDVFRKRQESERVFKSGPRQGEVAAKPAEYIDRKLYVLGVCMSELTLIDLLNFKKNFPLWLSNPANRGILKRVEDRIQVIKKNERLKQEEFALKAEDEISKKQFNEIAAAIANRWIKDAANSVRQGLVPSWIFSSSSHDREYLSSAAGRRLGCLALRVKGKNLSEADRNRIRELVVSIVTARIVQTRLDIDAAELVHLFHPCLRKYRLRE